MNATTSDLAALQAAVNEQPMDRATRLVYADCLEESGDDKGAARQRKIAKALGERVLSVPAKLAKRVKTLLGYKGRKVYLSIRQRVTLTDRWYDGGTKSDWYDFSLAAGHAVSLTGANVSPWNAGPDPVIKTGTATVILERVHFCGKDMGIRIYCHPDLFPDLLD